MPKFYTAFDRPPRVPFECTDESRTVQDFAKDCDINNIVKRAQRTGTIPVLQQGDLVFGVAPNESLQDTMNRYNEIREHFEGLPSELRLKFGNDPMSFAEYMADEANWAEARKLGLLPPETAPGSVANATPAAPSGGQSAPAST